MTTTKKAPTDPQLSKLSGGELLASAPSGGYYVGEVHGGHTIWADYIDRSGARWAALRGPFPKAPKIPKNRPRRAKTRKAA